MQKDWSEIVRKIPRSSSFTSFIKKKPFKMQTNEQQETFHFKNSKTGSSKFLLCILIHKKMGIITATYAL
jgi:hypothetical protein